VEEEEEPMRVEREREREREFRNLTNDEKLPHILGENQDLATLAAKYVAACHNPRDSQ